MVRKQTVFFLSLSIAGLILMVNFYLSGQGVLAIAALLPAGLMVYARRSLQPVMAHISLAVFTVMSAIGVILNNALMPMVLALTAALASWDFELGMHREIPTTGFYENLHVKYLGLALGLGLAGTGIGQLIHWRLPFILLLISGMIMVVSIDRLLSYFQQNGDTNH